MHENSEVDSTAGPESHWGRDRDRERNPDRDRDGGRTRRAVLAALGAGAGLSTLDVTPGRVDSSDTAAGTARHDSRAADATIHVRVYPGPIPMAAWLRYGWRDFWSGEFPVHRDVTTAVEGALEQIVAYAEGNSSLDDIEAVVETAEPVRQSPSAASGAFDLSVYSRATLLDRFRRVVHEREAVTGTCTHLLLWWDPTNYMLGYGGTRAPNTHVSAVADEGAQAVANVGATEVWDSRPVTRNIAIHETLHTFLSADVVEDVVGSRCDHDLGTAVRTEENTLRISPMATAYAGPDRLGGGTRFHGTGCYDHDSFFRHDGYEGIDRWEYTPELSEATLEAVTLYLERRLA